VQPPFGTGVPGEVGVETVVVYVALHHIAVTRANAHRLDELVMRGDVGEGLAHVGGIVDEAHLLVEAELHLPLQHGFLEDESLPELEVFLLSRERSREKQKESASESECPAGDL